MDNIKLKPRHIFAALVFALRLAFKVAPIRTGLTILITIALGLSPAVEAFVMREIVNNVTRDRAQIHFILLLAIIFLGTAIFTNLRHRLDLYINAWTGLKLEEKIIDNIGKFSPMSFHDTEFNAFLKLVADRGQRLVGIVSDITGFITWVISLLSVLSLLAFVNPLVAVFALAGCIPQTIHMQKSLSTIILKGMEIAELMRLSRHYMESFTSQDKLAETKIFDAAQFFTDKMQVFETKIAQHGADEKKEENLPFYGFALLSTALSILSQIIIIRSVGAGDATIGDYMLYNLAHQKLFGLFSVSLYYYSISKKASGLALMEQFLKNNQYVEDTGAVPVQMEGIITSIRFQDVSFAYNGTDMVLKNLSFQINQGETLALVGVNGGGKTTLAKLICGLYQPTSGTIYYNGLPHHAIAPSTLRNKCTIVLQEYCKYGLTIGENIAFSESYPREAVQSFLQDVSFDPLKEGASLDTLVLQNIHDGGANFSEGQWQKIAIARGLSKPADIIILDEPSSALDAKSEDDFYKLVKAQTHFSLKILISHRLACVQDVSRIVVLDGGTIIQDGTHQALVAQKGTYQELFTIQANKYSLV